MRRLVAVLTACVVLCMGLAACEPYSPYDQGFRVPLSGEPTQLDPQVCADEPSRTVVLSLFEGLTRLDDNGQPIAAAAESWECSSDGKIYTFHLGDGKWSDGTPVTAADFVYGIQRAVDKATASPLASLAFGIVGAKAIHNGKAAVSTLGVTAVDSRTVRITLTKADTDFLYTLAFPPFMPCKESFFLSTNARYGLETEYLLSNGAFTLSSWSHGESLLLTRNEHYAARADIYPERVRMMITVTEDVPTAIANGTLDVGALNSDQLTAATDAGAQILTMSDTICYAWFNATLPCLSTADLRTVLRDSIEWEGLPALLDRAGMTAATGYITPDATLDDGTRYRTNQNAIRFVGGGKDMHARLASALADASVSAMPTLTVLCPDDDASIALAQYIIQSWQRNIGVYFCMEPISAASLAARVKSGDYQIALHSVAAGSTAKQSLLAFCTEYADTALYQDTATVRYLSGIDGDDRAEWELAERTVANTCPAVPLGFVPSYYAVANRVEGLIVRAFGGGVHQVVYDFRHALKHEE